MPDEMNNTPIQVAWLNYAKSVQILLVPQIDDRPLDQYLVFRDSVLSVVQSNQFLDGLNFAWAHHGIRFSVNGDQVPPAAATPQLAEIGDALLLELQAFPRAVEVAQSTTKPEDSKGRWRTMLGRAATVSGSVNDLLDNLPPYAKQGLTLFKELIDLFKGKD